MVNYQEPYTFKRSKAYITQQGGQRVEVNDSVRAMSECKRMSEVFKCVVTCYQGHRLVYLFDRGIKRFG